MLPANSTKLLTRKKVRVLILRHFAAGSLVLGQDQQCYGGCFSPQRALDGDMANVRVWSRALDQVCFHFS